ncbi:MAG: hypothetical protein IKS08_00090 [Alphaproteobacteria bacterium]|nr:hypothetical protein [Alphaproteobacteria bacterium]
MSKWVEKSKKPLRLKARIKLLKRYSRHIDEARMAFARAENFITWTVDGYSINPVEHRKSCMYRLNEPTRSSVENPGTIVYNECFDVDAVCKCNDCTMHVLNEARFAAKKELDDAINAKWNWILGRKERARK